MEDFDNELTHFELGWIKPGHKWIKRKRSKNGKRWIYTYTDTEKKVVTQSKLAAVQSNQANKYDELATQLELEIQQTYGNATSLSPARLKELNKKKAALAYYRQQSLKSKNKAETLKKSANKEIVNYRTQKAITLKEKVQAFIKHPLNKKKRNQLIQKGQKIIANKLHIKASDAINSISFKNNKLSIEDRQIKENERLDRIQKIKDKNKKAVLQYNEQKQKIEKLKSNAIDGLKVQAYPTISDTNVKKSNPHYNDNYDSTYSYKEYHSNCANCSVAYDMRERGYDVEAKGYHETTQYDSYDDIGEMISEGLYTGKNVTCVGAYSDLSLKFKVGVGSTLYSENNTTDTLLQKAKQKKSSDVPSKYQTWTPYYSDDSSQINNKVYLDELEKEMLKGGNGSRGIFQCSWSEHGKIWGGHSMAYEVKNNEVVIIDAQTNDTYQISDFYENSCSQGFLRTDNLTPTNKIKAKVK